MDAKERLRLYLEQRRDAGETELVLDSMSVEEVMRMLGAGSASGGRPVERTVRPEPASAATRADDRARPESAPPPTDWRQALRALDPRPVGEQGTPAPQGGDAARPPSAAARRTDAERAPAPQPRALPSPEATVAQPARPMIQPAEGQPREASHATLPLDQIPTGLVVGSPVHELFGGPQSPYATLDDIAQAARACQRCALHATARQAVPGEGSPDADLVCVGEAPGANEDEQGRPFVGQAGQLLTKILAAINLSREEVFICNVLKHRPPGNRNPTPDEVAACSPFLVRQIEILSPRVILALGTFAAQTLLQTKEPIGKLRGKIHRYYGVPLIVTYHPAALLRNPSWKRPTWEDVQLARRILDRARGA